VGGSISRSTSGRGRSRAVRRGSVVVVAALLLGACGDDGEGPGDADGDPGSQAAPTTTIEDADATSDEPEPRPSSGCDAEPREPVVEEERTLAVGGADRRYLLSVPTSHDGADPLPVVLSFHGLMEGADVHTNMTRYSALAEEEGFVAVFPHGTGDPVRWNTDLDADNGDLAYFDAVLEQIASEHCIDESRVYATGLSNGAMFTSLLVCLRADVLAAVAPVTGITHHDGCEPSRPVPIVSFHGTEDQILLFNGGVNRSAIPGFGGPADAPTTTAAPIDLDGEGYPASAAAFAAHNGCDPDPEDTELTEEVLHRVYRCPSGADVEFYIVIGGGHSWPSSEFSQAIVDIVGMTTFDIDATRDAWEFMSGFTNP
jgi:polyhydroxybutyrate depolymerase